MNFQKTFLLGRATIDPKFGEDAEVPVVRFSVATNKHWTDKSGTKQEETEFHNVVAFGKTAQFIKEHVKKSTLVFVEGHLNTRRWEGGHTTEIVVESIQLGK